ncbi:unnamed protein product, partial [Ectocarpus sp. 12 AP-2014]
GAVRTAADGVGGASGEGGGTRSGRVARQSAVGGLGYGADTRGATTGSRPGAAPRASDRSQPSRFEG